MTTTSPSMSTLEILEESLSYIKSPKNWFTGSLGYVGGRVCAIGALGVGAKLYRDHGRKILRYPEASDTPEALAALRRLHEALPSNNQSPTSKHWNPVGVHVSDVYRYNDDSSHADVVALFKRAIAAERNKFPGLPIYLRDQVKSMTTIEILVAARKHVGKKGNWAKGSLGEFEGVVCAAGALSSVAHHMDSYYHLGTPAFDQNGMEEAVKFLYEQIPAYAREYSDKVIKEYLDRIEGHPAPWMVHTDVHSARLSGIYGYNDGDRVNHHRTLTKWFDRAVHAARMAEQNA